MESTLKENGQGIASLRSHQSTQLSAKLRRVIAQIPPKAHRFKVILNQLACECEEMEDCVEVSEKRLMEVSCSLVDHQRSYEHWKLHAEQQTKMLLSEKDDWNREKRDLYLRIEKFREAQCFNENIQENLQKKIEGLEKTCKEKHDAINDMCWKSQKEKSILAEREISLQEKLVKLEYQLGGNTLNCYDASSGSNNHEHFCFSESHSDDFVNVQGKIPESPPSYTEVIASDLYSNTSSSFSFVGDVNDGVNPSQEDQELPNQSRNYSISQDEYHIRLEAMKKSLKELHEQNLMLQEDLHTLQGKLEVYNHQEQEKVELRREMENLLKWKDSHEATCLLANDSIDKIRVPLNPYMPNQSLDISELVAERDYYKNVYLRSQLSLPEETRHFSMMIDLETGVPPKKKCIEDQTWITPLWLADIRQTMPWTSRYCPTSIFECTLSPARIAICYVACLHLFLFLLFTHHLMSFFSYLLDLPFILLIATAHEAFSQ